MRSSLRQASFFLALFLALQAQDARAQAEESFPSLQDIVVTASRGSLPGESSRSTKVLGPKQLAAIPAASTEDFLRGLPGLIMRRADSRTSNAAIVSTILRGVGDGRTLVLADGVPLIEPFTGGVLWPKVPAAQVERVEVVRGAASGLYGNQALGGVIQLFTHPTAAQRNSLELEYGSFDMSHMAVTLSTRIGGGAAVKVFGDFFNTNGYPVVDKVDRGPIDGPQPSASRNIGFRTDWQASDRASFFVSGQYFHSDQINDTPGAYNRYRILDGAAGANLATDRGDRWQLRLFGGRERLFIYKSYVPAGRVLERPQSQQNIPIQQAGGSLLWTRTWDAGHALTFGVDAQQTSFTMDEDLYNTNTGVLLGRPGYAAGKQALTGLFTELTLKPAEHWTLTAGLRGDLWRNSNGVTRSTAGVTSQFAAKNEAALSPHLGAIFHPLPALALRAAAYTGFKAPILNDLYRNAQTRFGLTLANPDLTSERLMGGEAGFDWAPVRSARLSATGFYNHLKNPIQTRTLSASVSQAQNLGKARSYGAELELQLALTRALELEVGYSYTRTQVLEFLENPAVEGKWFRFIPQIQGLAELRWKAPSRVNAGLRVRAEGHSYYDDVNTQSVPGFAMVDASLSRPFGAAELFFSGTNILDKRALATFTNPPRYGAPRRFWGGVRWKF